MSSYTRHLELKAFWSKRCEEARVQGLFLEFLTIFEIISEWERTDRTVTFECISCISVQRLLPHTLHCFKNTIPTSKHFPSVSMKEEGRLWVKDYHQEPFVKCGLYPSHLTICCPPPQNFGCYGTAFVYTGGAGGLNNVMSVRVVLPQSWASCSQLRSLHSSSQGCVLQWCASFVVFGCFEPMTLPVLLLHLVVSCTPEP